MSLNGKIEFCTLPFTNDFVGIQHTKTIDYVKTVFINGPYQQYKMESKSIPNEWFCPITQQIMMDPVIGSDGHTYQRKAIIEWLTKNPISPVTRQPMDANILINNLALRSTIQQMAPESHKILLQQRKKTVAIEEKKPKEQEKKERKEEKTEVVVKEKAESKEVRQKPDEPVKPLIESEVTMEIDTMMWANDLVVSVALKVPELQDLTKRKKVSIVAVVDTSFSMHEEIILRSEYEKELSDGFTRVDMVRHSINCIMEVLNEEDEMALVVFNNDAQVLDNWTKLDTKGKDKLRESMRKIWADGMTDMWSGLFQAYELCRKRTFDEDRHVVVIMLTDGEPNTMKRQQICKLQKEYSEKNPNMPNIHMFAYGYQVNSRILGDLCANGFASYSYIPDFTIMSSTFINFLSNVLSMHTCPVRLTFEPDETKTKISRTFGRPTQDKVIELAHIQHGQSRNQVMLLNKPSSAGQYMKVTLQYGLGYKYKQVKSLNSIVTQSKYNIHSNVNRFMSIDAMRQARRIAQQSQDISTACDAIKNARQFLSKSAILQKDPFTQTLLEQFSYYEDPNKGQIRKCFFIQQWWDKWGQHYLPSVISAHMMQLCTNNRDIGTRYYGGKTFKAFQKQTEQIFKKMAAPKPSIPKKTRPPPRDLREYMDYGGCILGHCLVTLHDRTTKNISQLTKGDRLQRNSIVKCVLKTNVNREVTMVKFADGLEITPYHPIFIDGEWKFPIDQGRMNKVYVSEYYNFVLQGGCTLKVNGILCISLGHNMTENQIVKHEYLGTNKVLDDLQKHEGWQVGYVEVRGFERNPETNLICKMII